MKKRVLWIAGIGICMALFGSIIDPADRLIWNRTESAPLGLYWLSNAPFIYGRWGVVSARSADADWAESNGFVGSDWPLLKKVAGVPGDEICRMEQTVSRNGAPVAQAHLVDSQGRYLPVWHGCLSLQEGQVFLLNVHPDSLDGRYFGPTQIEDMDGVAIALFTFNR